MAKTYSLWKVQELANRVRLEEEYSAIKASKTDGKQGLEENLAYRKVLGIIQELFGPEAIEGSCEVMKEVFCVMKKQGELFAIYETKSRAEKIVEQMIEKHGDNYYVETRTVFGPEAVKKVKEGKNEC